MLAGFFDDDAASAALPVTFERGVVTSGFCCSC